MTPSSPSLVLLAEDHAPTAEITREIIETFGYTVAHAETGQQAVEMARELRPALILMDVQMPELDGLSATQVLKKDPATSGIPIVCLTAFATKEQSNRSLEAGASDHLTKPLDFARLETLLRRYAPLG